MGTRFANGDSRLSELSFWPRVREFAVPASMIETATARRVAGDWAGACAAAGVDVDLNLRSLARDHGREVAGRVRDDLRCLAPDLLRWHMPRIAPDGLLRPGLTLALARYGGAGHGRGQPLYLVVRTPPAWADAGQRISLAVWGGGRPVTAGAPAPRGHPHPRPSRRFRLDLHRHLWDAERAGELRVRVGCGFSADGLPGLTSPYGPRCAVGRWGEEARLLLRAEGRSSGGVVVRLEGRRRILLDVGGEGVRIVECVDRTAASALPLLPDAATWVPPDLELLRAGAVDVGRLHPLVASALVPERSAPTRHPPADSAGAPRVVECRGARHRIGLVGGVLAPLDHEPEEIRREELLAALTGTPLPCLQAIDDAHRHPQCLPDVRERLSHGDFAGALAVVEGLLGPDAVLRDGALREELETVARRRITYGLFRAGLIGPGPGSVRYDGRGDRGRPSRGGRGSRGRRTSDNPARPRHATFF
ncbi:hypothetical protein IM697_00310 [Streptomyces ferrugineus]|uniref:Uncharacterized protein n=1 Tax=Streptomyces ferrugineus TaxID=1413221 RepID=A0A7M2SNB4_9ACTN|nr:hypothetical protein [Streptomyces ferrugineus]QOV36958.1 hypothetical protein IM697_00310 [Streptomyces ferrugineus]